MDNVVEMEIRAVIDELYEKDAKEIKRMVDSIIWKYGGLSGKDRDDFYSIANDTVSEVLHNIENPKDGKTYFNPTKGDFKGYIYRAISLAIIDDIKYRNASKRSVKHINEDGETIFIPTISIDAPIAEDESLTVGDFLCSQSDGFEIMDAISEGNNDFLDEHIENFLNSLTLTQKKIVQYRMDGVSAKEIQDELGLTKKQYEVQLKEIKSYEHSKFLRRKNVATNRKEDEIMITSTTSEKTKDTHISVASMRKKLRNKEWRDDHILQRYSGMWKSFEMSELMVDIMSGKSLTQIIVSEEVKDGMVYRWLIDGKQRCTNIDSYCHGDYSINKNVQRPMIEFQTVCRDDNGEFILNEDGFPTYKTEVCDVRGKKFYQLPEELQDKILDYPIPVMLNLNCNSVEIAYDIARFNRSRPMNKSQNGWTGMEEDAAFNIDRIIDRMKFFKTDFHGSGYTDKNKKNGELRRVVTDSIMSVYFLDEYNKEFNVTCKRFAENVTQETYAKFIELVGRLEKIADEETAKVFTATHSKVWFALFNECCKYNVSDEKFVEFVKAFNEGLSEVEINGKNYKNATWEKSSRDKSIVKAKVNHLIELMVDYFNTTEETTEVVEEQEEVFFELDSNWQDYITKFSKTDLIVNSDLSDEEVITTGIQAVMLLKNAEELKDSTVQEYASTNYVDDEEVENVLSGIDMLNIFVNNIDKVNKLNSSNIAIMVYATNVYNHEEIDDDVFETTLKEWLENWSGDNTADSIIENYSKVMADIESIGL